MICFALFISFTSADEFWKTICICPPDKCKKYTKCDNLGQPFLDPDSPSFIEDFNLLRKNIKNVEVYFNAFNIFDVNFDMRDIAGLTMNFVTNNYKVNIILKYLNDDTYKGSFLTFADSCVPRFIPIEDDKQTNVLNIGLIKAKNTPVLFFKNKGKNTVLKIASFELGTASLLNISAIEKTASGLNYFKLWKEDTVDIRFSKSGTSFKLNSNNIGLTLMKGDSFKFEGSGGTSTNADTIKLTIDADIPYADIPDFYICYMSFVQLYGKFWKPSETSPIKTITQVRSILVPAGDFPFSVFADNFELNFTGDTTFYGDIDALLSNYGASKMAVNTDSTKKINITFNGYVDSMITVKSPYLNLNINNLTVNDNMLDSKFFPVGCCFNDKAASYTFVKSFTFKGSSQTDRHTILCYPTITEIFTDEQLDANEIIKGFVFVDLPPKSISVTSFEVSIDATSPSAKNNVPGFGKSKSFCMKVTLDEEGRSKLKCSKYMSAYSAPVYICV